MWYNLNVKKLSVLLLPTLLRDKLLIYYLYCAIKPLERMHFQWLRMRKNTIYKLNHNGQVCYFQGALNDRFDPDRRRIVIMDSHRYKEQYIYTIGEKKPKYLGVMYLRQASDFVDNGVDFVVLAPAALLDKNNYEMKSLIDYYRLASKRYIIDAL